MKLFEHKFKDEEICALIAGTFGVFLHLCTPRELLASLEDIVENKDVYLNQWIKMKEGVDLQKEMLNKLEEETNQELQTNRPQPIMGKKCISWKGDHFPTKEEIIEKCGAINQPVLIEIE